jgi:hypothetical protein
MTANYVFERAGKHRGRAVRACMRAWAGAEISSCQSA